MGSRGPKGETKAVKDVKAAVRSRRQPPKVTPVEAAPIANAVRSAPPWLIGGGLDIWARLAPTLTLAKLLTSADELAFARYCRNFGDWLKLRGELDVEGYAYEAESYAAKPAGEGAAEAKTTTLRRLDPRFLISDRLERQLLAAEDRFGLNPSERQRIMVGRANTGYGGGLFDNLDTPPDPKGAASAAQPSQPSASPIGLLN